MVDVVNSVVMEILTCTTMSTQLFEDGVNNFEASTRTICIVNWWFWAGESWWSEWASSNRATWCVKHGRLWAVFSNRRSCSRNTTYATNSTADTEVTFVCLNNCLPSFCSHCTQRWREQYPLVHVATLRNPVQKMVLIARCRSLLLLKVRGDGRTCEVSLKVSRICRSAAAPKCFRKNVGDAMAGSVDKGDIFELFWPVSALDSRGGRNPVKPMANEKGLAEVESTASAALSPSRR